MHQVNRNFLKTDLANLKSNGDKLDFNKLKIVPTNLSNSKSKEDKLDADKLVSVPVDLSDVVKNDIVIGDKIPDTTNLATNTTLNAKIN